MAPSPADQRLFAGRRLLVATKHRKEQVIAPILEAAWGVRCVVPDDFDSDRFGTFTGEVARTADPVTTARRKCRAALSASDCDLGVASEGSFGPHPVAWFAPADDEVVLLLDLRNDLAISAHEVSLETNFATAELHNEQELNEFARAAGFPSHGVILRPSQSAGDDLSKGCANWPALLAAFKYLEGRYGSAFAETDMRARYNPSRMRVIAAATRALVERVGSTCPNCAAPGFAVAGSAGGLPCRACGLPTRTPARYRYSCQRCGHVTERPNPEKEWEEPAACDWCNP